MNVKLVELGPLSAEQYGDLVGTEEDPWEAGDSNLEWRPKDRHVAVRDSGGRLLAAAGLVLADVQFGRRSIPVVGLGGVIVAAPHRGRGFGWQVISEAIRRAHDMGPEIAMLFCRPDRAPLYRRHRFLEVPPPVLVEQPDRAVEIPMVTMWRPLNDGARLPGGAVKVQGLPF